MHLKEYMGKAKKELDEMEEKWIEQNKIDPVGWPMEMEEQDWIENELDLRDLA